MAAAPVMVVQELLEELQVPLVLLQPAAGAAVESVLRSV